MSSASCLVTGGSGFLGRHVVAYLKDAGNDVVTLGRTQVDGTRTILADITAPDLELNGHRFSTVYHAAGKAHVVPRTQTEKDMFFKVNVEGTRNLLDALKRTGQLPEAFVLISTIAVYGLEEGTLLDETVPRNASDPYGASKREAEDLVMEWGARHGARATALRLPLVVGKNAPGNLGAMVHALKRGRYVGVGSGSARRSMVMARDVSRILPEAARVGGVFNLSDGYHPSFAELENALSEALRRKPPHRLPVGVLKLGALVGDRVQGMMGVKLPLNSRTLLKMTSTLTLSDERARQELGWKPSRVLDYASELVS